MRKRLLRNNKPSYVAYLLTIPKRLRRIWYLLQKSIQLMQLVGLRNFLTILRLSKKRSYLLVLRNLTGLQEVQRTLTSYQPPQGLGKLHWHLISPWNSESSKRSQPYISIMKWRSLSCPIVLYQSSLVSGLGPLKQVDMKEPPRTFRRYARHLRN